MVDLHGYDPERRVEAAGVFGPALRVLGVGGADIPPDAGGQGTVYHQLLDALGVRGRPVLLVLDNASSAGQVEDLLPRHPAHRVLVTSRHTLGTLPGVPLDPGVDDEARAHRYHLLGDLLDAEARRRAGERLDAPTGARLAAWKERLRAQRLVVAYDLTTEQGYHLVAARIGVDVDLVRATDPGTTLGLAA
ncbi:hypothetical protein [Longispora urticae]